MSDTVFKAGAAKEDITPDTGTLLYGYVPDSVSTSVHDGLELTAAAFSQGETGALIVSVSAGDIQTELARELCLIASEASGICAENVLIAATHTHSAPNISGMEGWGDIDRKYVDTLLIPALRSASSRAVSDMRRAEIAVGAVRSEVGINRRQQLKDGTVILGQNPHGCYDPYMTVISIRDAENKSGIINIVHYGCHGTAAGNNREITRDWPGVMTDALEKRTNTPTTFINGAIGDVGPRLTNGATVGDISHVESLGGIAAGDALRAYEALGEYKEGSLQVVNGTVSIPRKPLLPYGEAKERISRYKEPEKTVNIERLQYAHLRSILDEYEKGCPEHEKNFSYRQALISLGDIVFIPFPFEIFSEISMRLREYSPFEYTLSMSNVNGYEAYLPTEDQLVRGGYEVGCFCYNGAHPLRDDADQTVIDENMKLIEKFGKAGK